MSNLKLKVTLPLGSTGGRWELIPDLAALSAANVLTVTTAWGLINSAGTLVGKTLEVGAGVTLPAQPGSYATLRTVFNLPNGNSIAGTPIRVELKETSTGVMDIVTLVNAPRAIVTTPPGPTFTPAQAAPPPAVVIPPPAPIGTITSTAKGSVLSWTASPVGQYHIYRSVESAAGYPELTFYRLTTAPITATSFKDLFLYEGESTRYRVMVQPGNGNPSLHVQMDVTQVSYGTGDALMTVTNTGNSSTGVNTISGKVFRTLPGQTAINIQSDYEYLVKDCIFIGSGDGSHALSGVPRVTFENCFFLGVKPPAGYANKSVGQAFSSGYNRYFGARQCTVRGMGGFLLNNYRGADTNRPMVFDGMLFWDVNRRRVDASGAYIQSDWSDYHGGDFNATVTAPPDSSKPDNPATPEVLGRNVCNILQITNKGAAKDGLTAACKGGLLGRGILVVGTPGKTSMDDAVNFNQASGESELKPNKIQVICVFNNPSFDYTHTAGQPWKMGTIPSAVSGKGPPYQSQSGTLLADGGDPGTYERVSSYNTVEDGWFIGLGVQVSIQAGHFNKIVRPTVRGSRLSPDGTSYTSITGGSSNSNPSITDNKLGNGTDNGQPIWQHNSISGLNGIVPDSFNVGATNAGTGTYPWGMDTKDTDLTASVNNVMVQRDATIPEMWAGYHAFLDKCASIGVTRLGVVPV